MDFRREPAARAAERLIFLPPFAPAAETWARTIVESNIWIKWADALISANVSKKASNTPALLSRSKRLHTEFQWPKRSGSARQRTFSTVKKCIASRTIGRSWLCGRAVASRPGNLQRVRPIRIGHLRGHRRPPNQSTVHESDWIRQRNPKPIPESIRPHGLALQLRF